MMPARSSRESRRHEDRTKWKRRLAMQFAIIGTLILLLCCGLTALLLRVLLYNFPPG